MVVTTFDEAKIVLIGLKHCEEDVHRLRNELEEEQEEKLKQGDVVQSDLQGQDGSQMNI